MKSQKPRLRMHGFSTESHGQPPTLLPPFSGGLPSSLLPGLQTLHQVDQGRIGGLSRGCSHLRSLDKPTSCDEYRFTLSEVEARMGRDSRPRGRLFHAKHEIGGGGQRESTLAGWQAGAEGKAVGFG